jgi:hypothetical protein
MSELIPFDLGDNTMVFVETADADPVISPVSRADAVLASTSTSFETALAQVRRAASTAVAAFRDMSARPDEVQIEFGVKLNAEAGAVIAKTAVDGHLRVLLSWHRDTWHRAAPPTGSDQDPNPVTPA